MGKSLTQLRILQVGRFTGEPGFCNKLLDALKGLGRFELTSDRSQADGVVEANGMDRDDGFAGDLRILDLNGDVMWAGHALRPHGTPGPMAYERLISQLRDALIPSERSRSA